MPAKRVLEARIIQKAREDAEFRKELIADPHKAIQKAFNIDVPEEIKISVFEETKDHYCLVIPVEADDAKLTDEQLEALAAGVAYRSDHPGLLKVSSM